MTVIAFIIIAAAFTLVRVLATANQPAGQIPWRTLAVNVIGSFALGVIVAAEWWTNPVVATAGGLGSLTTFSTVAAETAALLDNDRKGRAIAYVGLTLIVGIAAAWVGLSIGETA